MSSRRTAFISHTSPDDGYVAELESFLRASGFDEVFNDVHAIRPDERFWPKIEEGIRACTTFYVVIGEKTKDSPWVAKGIEFARAEGKSVVPVWIEDCEMPAVFADRDVIDFRPRSRPRVPQRIAPSRLVSRQELALLDAAWDGVKADAANGDSGGDSVGDSADDPEPWNVNVLSLIAWGGVGKTALLAEWVDRRLRQRDWKNDAGEPEPIVYFDWTFYDQGTRSDDATHAGAASLGTFFIEALRHFGDPEPERLDRPQRPLSPLVPRRHTQPQDQIRVDDRTRVPLDFPARSA